MNLKTEVTRKQNRPNYPKNEPFFTPWYTHKHVHIRGKKYSFFRKFGASCFPVTTVWWFILLPYYQRIGQSFNNHFQINWNLLSFMYELTKILLFNFRNSDISLNSQYQRIAKNCQYAQQLELNVYKTFILTSYVISVQVVCSPGLIQRKYSHDSVFSVKIIKPFYTQPNINNEHLIQNVSIFH